MNYHCPRPPKQRAFDTSLLMWRRRFLSGTAFSPASLFASGEDGGWYDPSDLTSMYVGRNGSGGNPTAGSVVGVVLDKSQMGGQTAASFIAGQPELADVFADTGSDWSISGTTLTGLGTAGGSTAFDNTATVAGQYYLVTYVVTRVDGLAQSRIGNTFLETIGSSGTRTFVVKAADAAGLRFTSSGSFDGTIEVVTFKAIPGNHLVAPSDAARPLLQTEGGRYYLDFDGVDDRMDFTQITGATGTEFETVFGVSYNDVTPNSDEVLGSSGSSKIGQTNGAVFVRIEGTGTAITTGATADGVKYVQGAYTNGTTEVSRLNGSDTATRAVPGATWAFSRVGVGDGANYFLGRIYGITIIDRALTTEERYKLEYVLAQDSGVTYAAPVLDGVPTIG